MKGKSLLSFIVLSLGSIQGFAAQVDIKPGLWERTEAYDEGSIAIIKKQMQLSARQNIEAMKKSVAKLPPEQRAQIEAMAKQQGDVDQVAGALQSKVLQDAIQPKTVKQCITQERLNKGFFSAPEKNNTENCQDQRTQVNANTFKLVSLCKGPNPSHHEVEVVVQNPKLFTGTLSSFVSDNGASQVIKAKMTSKWLASDCGNIKPDADEDDEYDEHHEDEDHEDEDQSEVSGGQERANKP